MRHLEEGTIHAWLDGALSPDEAAHLSAHLDSCSECSDRVVEARGLIAGSARILAALDDTPSGITPRKPDGVPARFSAPQRGRVGRRGARWFTRPVLAAAAAVAVVASGTILVRHEVERSVRTPEASAIPEYPSPPPTFLPESLRSATPEPSAPPASEAAAAVGQRKVAEVAVEPSPANAPDATVRSEAADVAGKAAATRQRATSEPVRAVTISDSAANLERQQGRALEVRGAPLRRFAEPPQRQTLATSKFSATTLDANASLIDSCYSLHYEQMRGTAPERLPEFVLLRRSATDAPDTLLLGERESSLADRPNVLVLAPRAMRLAGANRDTAQHTGDFIQLPGGILEFAWRDGANTVRVTLAPADSTSARRTGDAVAASLNGAATWSARIRAVTFSCEDR